MNSSNELDEQYLHKRTRFSQDLIKELKRKIQLGFHHQNPRSSENLLDSIRESDIHKKCTNLDKKFDLNKDYSKRIPINGSLTSQI